MSFDPNNVEEVDVPERMPLPPVEELVRQAAVNINRFDTPNGPVTILQFITPFKIYSFQLDNKACEGISDALRPSKIVPATLLDLPPGAKV